MSRRRRALDGQRGIPGCKWGSARRTSAHPIPRRAAYPFVVEKEASRYRHVLAVEVDHGGGGHGGEESWGGELMRSERRAAREEELWCGACGGSVEQSACRSREHSQQSDEGEERRRECGECRRRLRLSAAAVIASSRPLGSRSRSPYIAFSAAFGSRCRRI